MSDDEFFGWVTMLFGGPERIARLFDETFSPGVIPPALSGPKAVSSVGDGGTRT